MGRECSVFLRHSDPRRSRGSQRYQEANNVSKSKRTEWADVGNEDFSTQSSSLRRMMAKHDGMVMDGHGLSNALSRWDMPEKQAGKHV